VGGLGNEGRNTMYHYEYVSKRDAKPYRDEFLDIIHEIQNLLRDKFTFSYKFVGSSSRNMITCDFMTNKGFDFDVDFYINDDEEEYSAEEIKKEIMKAINKVAPKRGFQYCEDSTRVITVKSSKEFANRTEYSCDICIVNEYVDKEGKKRQQYIRHQKSQNNYKWVEQSTKYYLESKIRWLKGKELWNDVLKLYIYKKNNNLNPYKKSRALYAETIHEICQKNGYI